MSTWGQECHKGQRKVSGSVVHAHVGLGVMRGSPGVNWVNVGCVGSFPKCGATMQVPVQCLNT